jgi:hypothetical protein
LAAAGCAAGTGTAYGQARESGAGCRVRLIVRVERALDETQMKELERSTGARLELESELMAGRLYVLSLVEDGMQTDCETAAEQLRRDPRVRSVAVDARRQPRLP